MLKKISVRNLEPGMYIADSGIHWMDNPYIYSEEGEATSDLIQKIQGDGFKEVFIDTERSHIATAPDDEFGSAVTNGTVEQSNIPTVPLAEELPIAKATYNAALNQAKSFMDGIRKGEHIDVEQAKHAVDDIIASVARNHDAIIGLSKLRTADDYTYSHCVNVAVLGVMFARHMQLSPEVQHEVGVAGMFHDIGKALIPLEILNAPRSLSDQEFAILRRHSRLGFEEIQKNKDFSQNILLGVYDHHERYNGSGYPRGLNGAEISITGRILALADVYDALSSTRPYKKSIAPNRVLAIMYQMRGEDFYPGDMENFIRMMGIYPVGSIVELTDGGVAVVSASNQQSPMKPSVICVQGGSLPQHTESDLSLDGMPQITRCLDRSESLIDPARVLGL